MLEAIRGARYLIGGTWTPLVIIVVLAVIVSVVETTAALLLYGLLGIISGSEGTSRLPFIGDFDTLLGDLDISQLYVAAAVTIGVFFVVRGVIIVGQNYVRDRITEMAGARLSARLLAGYLAVPYRARTERATADQIRNAHETVQRFVDSFFWPVVVVLSESILVAALATVLLVTAPLATVLVASTVIPLVLLGNRAVRPRLQRLGEEHHELSSRSIKMLQETLDGLELIKLAGREQFFAGRFEAVRRRFARTRYLQQTLGSIPAVGLETVLVLIVAVFLGATALAGGDQAQVLPVLGLFGYVGLRLLPLLERIVVYGNTLRFSRAAIDDIHHDLRQAETWLQTDAPDAAPLKVRDGIKLTGVTVRYPERDDDAIERIDLTIPPGTFLGLAGKTGSGKSTLLMVMAGLRDPTSGSVTVDAVPVATIRDRWFRTIGFVPQDVFLLEGTVRDNITLGRDASELGDEAIARAVAVAQLEPVMAALPQGLDTPVGDHGLRLSGGQRQRVALARALVTDPDVLLLDEATSALDASTEAAVLQAIAADRPGRTIVASTHRLASIRHADVIIVLDSGTIDRTGTFDDLVAGHPGFREWVERGMQPKS